MKIAIKLLILAILAMNEVHAQGLYFSVSGALDNNLGRRAEDGITKRYLNTPNGFQNLDISTKQNSVYLLNNPFGVEPWIKLVKGNTGLTTCGYDNYGYRIGANVNYDFNESLGISAGLLYHKKDINQFYHITSSNKFYDFTESFKVSSMSIPLTVRFGQLPTSGNAALFFYAGVQFNKNLSIKRTQMIGDAVTDNIELSQEAYNKTTKEWLLGVQYNGSRFFQVSFANGTPLNRDFTESNGILPYQNLRTGLRYSFSFGINIPISGDMIEANRESLEERQTEKAEAGAYLSSHLFLNSAMQGNGCSMIDTKISLFNLGIGKDFELGGGLNAGIGIEHTNFGTTSNTNSILSKTNIGALGASFNLDYLGFEVGASGYWNYWFRNATAQNTITGDAEFSKYFTIESDKTQKFIFDYFVGYEVFPSVFLEYHYLPSSFFNKNYKDPNGFQPYQNEGSLSFLKLKIKRYLSGE